VVLTLHAQLVSANVRSGCLSWAIYPSPTDERDALPEIAMFGDYSGIDIPRLCPLPIAIFSCLPRSCFFILENFCLVVCLFRTSCPN
jgi:hypothetical protein